MRASSSSFDTDNVMKATRVVESLPKIYDAISRIDAIKGKTRASRNIINDYANRLQQIKVLIEKYRSEHILNDSQLNNTNEQQLKTNTLLGRTRNLFNSITSSVRGWKNSITSSLGSEESLTPSQRTEKYNDLATALRLVNETFMKYANLQINSTGRNIGKSATVTRDDRVAQSIMRQTIRDIRTYLGKPYPVKANEAFVVIINDYIRENFEEVYHLWVQEEAKTPAETLVRELVCSEPYNSPAYQANARRDGALDYLDYGLGYVSRFINRITFGSVERFGSLYTGKPIAEGLGRLFNFGTGLNYVTPSLITADRTEVKRICDNKLIPILPKSSDFEIDKAELTASNRQLIEARQLLPNDSPYRRGTQTGARANNTPSFGSDEYFRSNGKAYRSLYEYLLKNINKDVVALAKGEDPKAFYDWYDSNVKPIFHKVLERMDVDYRKLLQREYRESLLGKQFNFDKFMRYAWSSVFKAQWALPSHLPVQDLVRPELYNSKNSRGVLEDYVHQMERYLKLIEVVYDRMIERQPEIARQITTELARKGVDTNPLSFFSVANTYGLNQSVPRYLSDLRTTGQMLSVDQNKAYFKRTLNKLRSNIYEMLASLKEMNMDEKDIVFMPTSRGEVPEAPRIVGKRADFETLFAEALLNFKHVLQVLNISDEAGPILKSLVHSELFKEITKDHKTMAIANDRLMLRINNTASIGEKFGALALDRNIMNHYLGYKRYSEDELRQFFELRPVFVSETTNLEGVELDTNDINVQMKQVNPIYPFPMVQTKAELEAAYRSAEPIS